MFPWRQARLVGEGQEPRAQGISEADPYNFILALLISTHVILNNCLNFPESVAISAKWG